jgi:(S)-sulfolactate dehydrogenase
MADIVISEFLDEAALTAIPAHLSVRYDPALVDRPADLMAALASAKALVVRNRTQVRGALLETAANLKVVGRLGVGLDNIDMQACAARGISVHPATGANDVSVAEYVITSALLLLRGAYAASATVADGSWPRNALIGRETAGKTLGLIGFGAIARETASRAIALGMHVVAHDPYAPMEAFRVAQVRPLALDDLARMSDVVSLHVPLTPETRHCVGPAFLSLMKPDAILINAARGGVVDEAALVAALKSGRLGAAALDVFETEPLNAAAGALFKDCPNLILTPHIAGVTQESNVRVSHVTIANILKVLA